MVKKPIKTIDDIQKLMEEKQQQAERKRHEQMASGDAQPNGVSAAEMLNGQSKSESHPNPNGVLNGSNEISNGFGLSTTPQKKRKNKRKKNKNKANGGYDGTSADDSRISEKDEEVEVNQSNGNEPKDKTHKKKAKIQQHEQMETDEVEPNEATNGQEERTKNQRRKDKKKQQKAAAADNAESNPTENGHNGNHIEDTPAPNPRKRKAAQRAEANLAIVPLSQRKDDSDEDDQDYIVESPDEDGNPKRSKLGESDEDDSDEEDWSRQTLEQRIADMLGGGVFYDDDEGEDDSEEEAESDEDGPIFLTHHNDNEEEDETEVEISDSDDEVGRIDIDDGESSDEEGEDDDDEEFENDSFDESQLYTNDSDEDEEIMSFDEDRPQNSDEEIVDIVSTIRPKNDELSVLDDLYSAGIGHGSSDDEEDSIMGPVDDLDELAEDDENDLYAEDSDLSEDLGNFIAAPGESDEEDEDEMDDSEDDMDIDLGEDEYTDISPMFQMTTDYKFKIDGYRTAKENAFLLKVERTTAGKARGGPFTTFKFGQIADTHSVQIAFDAFSWMIAPIERDAFFSHLFQRRVLFVKRRDKNYFKGIFSSDALLRMVQEVIVFLIVLLT
uniref:Uncharacterized protein n=1 Tax=Panagrolaimus superbus TaxID=310955 RepID=A0A914Y2I0_9BILA